MYSLLYRFTMAAGMDWPSVEVRVGWLFGPPALDLVASLCVHVCVCVCVFLGVSVWMCVLLNHKSFWHFQLHFATFSFYMLSRQWQTDNAAHKLWLSQPDKSALCCLQVVVDNNYGLRINEQNKRSGPNKYVYFLLSAVSVFLNYGD